MFPKGSIRHPSEGDCPYIAVSRPEKGQVFSLPLKDITIKITAPESVILVSTYLPEENRCYYKSIFVVSGETMKTAFERASKIPFALPGEGLSGCQETISIVDAEFIDRMWRLGTTLVLIMASGEKLLEPGVRLPLVNEVTVPSNP